MWLLVLVHRCAGAVLVYLSLQGSNFITSSVGIHAFTWLVLVLPPAALSFRYVVHVLCPQKTEGYTTPVIRLCPDLFKSLV